MFRRMSSSPLQLMTLYFGAGALASEVVVGVIHPTTDEHGDRDGG